MEGDKVFRGEDTCKVNVFRVNYVFRVDAIFTPEQTRLLPSYVEWELFADLRKKCSF